MEEQNLSYKFPKAERLCLKNEIDALFNNGKWKRTGNIRMIFVQVEGSEYFPPKIMFSAPKKIFRKAVTRNLLKRRMREAYRLNKHIIMESCERNSKLWHVAFIYNATKIREYKSIESDIRKLLSQLG